ncbi:MAG: TolC family protein [Odoribacter sp.]
MKRGVLLTFIAFCLPCFLQAQETTTAPQSLSLQQAVDFAVEYNKELQASQMNISLRYKMVQEAISQGLPQINGSLDYTTNFNHEIASFKAKMPDQSTLGLSVSQLLFNGQWILGIQTSKIAKQMAAQQVDLTKLDIKETVYNSYYTILVCERLMNIIRQNLVNMDKILTHTDNMYKAGTAEITDVDQIRITVGLLKNNLLSMQRTVDVNYNLMRLQLGLQAGTPLTLSDPLDTFLTNGDFLKLSAQQFNLDNNSQYQLMQTQEELQKKMVGLKKWAYAPTITASYSYNYQIKSGLFSAPHTAGVTMNIPLFSGLQRKAQLDQEKITLEQTSLNKSLLQDQLYLQEEQYKYTLKNAMEDYNLQKENISVAKKVLDNYQRKYEAGVVSSLDLTQANNNYLQAENNYTSACLTLLQAQTQLEKLYNELK